MLPDMAGLASGSFCSACVLIRTAFIPRSLHRRFRRRPLGISLPILFAAAGGILNDPGPYPYPCNAHTHKMVKYRHPDFQMVPNLSQEHICYLLNSMGMRVQGGRPSMTVRLFAFNEIQGKLQSGIPLANDDLMRLALSLYTVFNFIRDFPDKII